MRGVEVVGKDGAMRKISIAFRPRDGRFEVADAAIRNDPEFLANVTELWNGRRPKPQIRRDLINALRDKGRAVDEKYEDAVERNLDRAHAITDYRFPRLTSARPRRRRMRKPRRRTSPRSSSVSTTRERDLGKLTLS
jgi:hypothetical protein